MTPLSRQLAVLSAHEMVAALGVRRAPRLVQRGLAWPFYVASRTLGRTLAGLDDAIASHGLPAAAAMTLRRFGVDLQTSGVALGEGPRLVLANHPGAYDALALMSALGRDDLRILAADRSFLRALPRLSSHLLFVAERPGERAGALKRAVRHLRNGGALLHFPAGTIEPDADFEPAGAPLLEPWQPGVAALVAACARFDGRVVVAGVRGVHSPRAKRWLLNRVAERRGITTLSPLLQMVGGLRDVSTRVCRLDVDSARGLAELTAPEQQAALRAALERAIRGSLS
jgi:1-acyl-sn-glycerol-3-phosphate acyltransferase